MLLFGHDEKQPSTGEQLYSVFLTKKSHAVLLSYSSVCELMQDLVEAGSHPHSTTLDWKWSCKTKTNVCVRAFYNLDIFRSRKPAKHLGGKQIAMTRAYFV